MVPALLTVLGRSTFQFPMFRGDKSSHNKRRPQHLNGSHDHRHPHAAPLQSQTTGEKQDRFDRPFPDWSFQCE